jgi:hypothetical protein
VFKIFNVDMLQHLMFLRATFLEDISFSKKADADVEASAMNALWVEKSRVERAEDEVRWAYSGFWPSGHRRGRETCQASIPAANLWHRE